MGQLFNEESIYEISKPYRSFNFLLNRRTDRRNQYAPNFFKVGGRKLEKKQHKFKLASF